MGAIPDCMFHVSVFFRVSAGERILPSEMSDQIQYKALDNAGSDCLLAIVNRHGAEVALRILDEIRRWCSSRSAAGPDSRDQGPSSGFLRLFRAI